MESRGFTLIELLIVIAIIGILVGIALPSYQTHVREANRVDMQLAMTEMSLVAERQYARQNSYPADVAATNVGWPSDRYLAEFYSNGDEFTITATPQGGQTSDKCGTMTLDEKGATTPSVTGCW